MNAYLNEIAGYKQTYYNTQLNNYGGYSAEFAKYIDDNFSLGIESEILAQPKNGQAFYKKKFDMGDIKAFTFVTDAEGLLQPKMAYEKALDDFIANATGTAPDSGNGWLTNFSGTNVKNIPIALITKSILPNVPVDNTSAAGGSLGEDVVVYGQKGYTELTKDNFKDFNTL